MNLKPHQLDIGKAVTTDLRENKKTRVVLQGAAGTGKTFLSTVLTKQLVNDPNISSGSHNGLVFVTAPTNKALGILQKKIMGMNSFMGASLSKIIFATIHSALGLHMHTNDKTGERKFVPGYSETAKYFAGCKAAIVDEASMVNTEILEFLNDASFPILFVGDSHQINPVGELVTPVFNQYWPTHSLTEIIRQGEGNPIIDLSRDLTMMNFGFPNTNSDGKGYVYSTNMDRIINNLAAANGTDELKYLSYMNKDVDQVNDSVRHKLYGDNPPKIGLGETVVFDEFPYQGHFINEEFRVEELNIITDHMHVPTQKSKFSLDSGITNTEKIKVKFYLCNDGVRILHEDSELLFNSIMHYLHQKCKYSGWGWKAYYWAKEQFAKFKYNHAITVHKSQGSTYREAVMNVANINRCKDPSERKRLLYTAVTRASDLLILHNAK